MTSATDIVVEWHTSLTDVSVVLLSYNRKDELLRNLPALCRSSEDTGFQLIVVDNASADGTLEVAKSFGEKYPSMKVILNENNHGVAEGRNIGARIARGEYILFIDDDVQICQSAMQELRNRIKRSPDIGILSPLVLHAKTRLPENFHGPRECDVGNYHGACHLVSRRAFEIIGDFDPLCMFGGEEIDYSIRARCNGFRVTYCPNVTVYHNSIIRSGDRGNWRRALWSYNYCRVLFKHFPMRMACIFSFRYTVSQLISGSQVGGLSLGGAIVRSALKGAIEGRKQYHPIPEAVRAYYCDPAVRPELGNVPLSLKGFCWLRAKILHTR